MSPLGSESSDTKKAAPSTASRASSAWVFRDLRTWAHMSLLGDVPQPSILPRMALHPAQPPPGPQLCPLQLLDMGWASEHPDLPPSPGSGRQRRQMLLVGAGG